MQQGQTKEDQERVEQLNQQGKHSFLLNQLSFLVAGLGGGLLGRGFFKKNENLKTAGWSTLVVGLTGVIYSLWKSIKVSSELRKTENANVVLEGKPLNNGPITAIGNLIDQRPPIQSDGCNTWETKIADRKAESGQEITPLALP